MRQFIKELAASLPDEERKYIMRALKAYHDYIADEGYKIVYDGKKKKTPRTSVKERH